MAKTPQVAMNNDLYQVLGVDRNVTQSDIQDAYTKLHSEYREAYDRGEQEASINLFNIKAAFEILSNEGKRSQYDNKLNADIAASVAVVEKHNSRKMPVSVFIAIFFILIAFIIAYIAFFDGIERYYLSSRFDAYMNSIYSGEKNCGYEYLTPKGRDMVTQKAWCHQSPSGQQLLQKEEIGRIRFSARNQDIAVIVVDRTLSSGVRDSYTQTWLKTGGVWHRAIDMDFSESRFREIAKNLSDKEQKYASFAIVSGNLTWSLSRTSGLVTPEVAVRISNTGTVPLKSLYILVSLIMDGEIFSRIERRIIGERDIPLGVGELSEIFHFSSDKGLVFDLTGDQSLQIARIKSAQQATTVKLYYKQKYEDEWIERPMKLHTE